MTSVPKHFTKYLDYAHSIEVQALAQLHTAPGIAGDPELSAMYLEDLVETDGAARGAPLRSRHTRPARTTEGRRPGAPAVTDGRLDLNPLGAVF